MISSTRAYDLANHYSSRYSYMLASTEIVDRANAESCRLACQAFQDIATCVQNIDPTTGERRLDTPDFDTQVKAINSEMIQRWKTYVETGIPFDEQKEIATPDPESSSETLPEGKKKSKGKDSKSAEPKRQTDPEVIPWIDATLIDDVVKQIESECGLWEEPEPPAPPQPVLMNL